MQYEIVIGKAERNLARQISGATDNHRTYMAVDEFWTGTESYDCKYVCSETCRDEILAPFPIRSQVVEASGTHLVALPSTVLSGDHRTVEDATVYPFSKAEPEMLPIVCAGCGTTMQDHENPSYEYASRVHAPNFGDDIWPPVCGSASASRNPLDDQPIAATEAQFSALPTDVQCWECRSIIA